MDSKQAAIIDWCTCTFDFDSQSLPALLAALSRASGYQLQAVTQNKKKGFADGFVIDAFVGFKHVELCTFSFGGESQRGRAMLDFPGASCGCIVDWQKLCDLLESLPGARLTRVDVAVDLHEGQFTVNDAVEWHREGRFNCSGRNPQTRTDGDWLEQKHGRTLYVGKTKNGKGLRCYEKGKQLGDLDSEWVRFEVQFGNRDRVIPFDILIEPTKYFVGAYPACEQIIEAAGERIKTISDTAAVVLGRILEATKRTYGKWLNHFIENGVDPAELIDEFRITERPKRIQASAVTSNVLPDTTKRAFDNWRSNHGN